MRFRRPLVPGRLVLRYQRFLADVRLDDGEDVVAHCPNPGTMQSLLRKDARVMLSRAKDPGRRTQYTWELVRVGRTWAGVNTMRTNHVVEAALRRHAIPELDGYEHILPETPMGENRRVDFLLRTGGSLCFVEVKNVTLAEGDRALFPDAVTARGTAHLLELAERVAEGHRAAAAAGVEILAYRARAGRRMIRVECRIPFDVG